MESNFSTSRPNSAEIQGFFLLCEGMPEGPLFWAAFTSVSFLVGFPSSAAVVWDLVQRQRRAPSSGAANIFKLSLTCMDTIFNFFVPTSAANYLIWKNVILESCMDFLFSFIFTGRPLFVTFICLDCYLAIIHPITYKSRNHLFYGALLSAAVWAITLAFGTLMITNYVSFVSPYIVTAYCTNLMIILLSDFFVLRALRKTGPGISTVHPMKKKAFQTVVNSLVLMVLLYLPPVVSYLYISAVSMPTNEAYCKVAIPCLTGPMFSSCMMPVLYLINLRKLNCRCH